MTTYTTPSKIKIWILDDKPLESGLPKLQDLRFFNKSPMLVSSIETLPETADSNGVLFEMLTPEQLYQKPSEAYEHAIIYIDVNWSDAASDIKEVAHLDISEKATFGVDLAEWVMQQRADIGADHCHIVFFSNSKQDTVEDKVEYWHGQDEVNIYPLVIGSGLTSRRNKVVELAFSAYRAMCKDILQKAPDAVVGEVQRSVAAFLKSDFTKRPVKPSDLLGDADGQSVGGYALKDLAYPFIGYSHNEIISLQKNGEDVNYAVINKKVCEAWLYNFDSRFIQIPLIATVKNEGTSKAEVLDDAAERLFVLKDLLRYQRIDYASFFIYGDKKATELTCPLKILESRLAHGLTKGSSVEPFFARLNRRLTNEIAGFIEGTRKIDDEVKRQRRIARSRIPEIFFDESVFAVERPTSGWNEDGLLAAHRGNDDTGPYWCLEVSAAVQVDCPHFNARRVAVAYKSDQSSLEDVYKAWQADQNHLDLLEILASEVNNLIDKGILPSSEGKEALGNKFASWRGRLHSASRRVQDTSVQLHQLACEDDAPKRVSNLIKQFQPAHIARVKWLKQAKVFEMAAKQLLGEKMGDHGYADQLMSL